MNLLLLAVLAANPPPVPVPLPTTTPEERGQIRVLEALQLPGSTTFKLEYTNTSGRELEKVRLECMMLDPRGDVVNTDATYVKSAKPGAVEVLKLKVTDMLQRAVRAECRIAFAREHEAT